MKRKLLSFIVVIFLFLEWTSVSRTAGLLLQKQALFYSSDKTEFQDGLNEALQCNPHNGPTHLYLASLYMKQNEYLRAREETRLALKYFASIPSYNQLGSINLSLGNLKEARRYFVRVLSLYPEEKNALLRMVALHLSLEENCQAREKIRNFLQAYPGDPNGYYFLGMIQLSEKDPHKALESFSKVNRLVLEPNPKLLFQVDDLYYKRALAESSLGQWKASESHLKKALALNSRVSYIQALSDVYLRQNELEKAKNVLQQGLHMHPNQNQLKALLLRVEKIINQERNQNP